MSLDLSTTAFDPSALVLNTKKMKWEKASFFTKIFRKIQDFFCKDAKWVRLAYDIDKFCRKHLENNKNVDPILYDQVKKLSNYALQHIKAKGKRENNKLKKSCSLLERQIVALDYRSLSSQAQPLEAVSTPKELRWLKEKIIVELQKEKHFWAVDFHSEVHSLNNNGNTREWFEKRWEEISSEIAKIPGLETLLTRYPDQLDAFILWTLRDNCPVEVFAGFPQISGKLKATYAAARIGRASEFRKKNHLLKVTKNKGECFVALRVEDNKGKFKRVPLLSRKKFTVGDKIDMTLKGLAKALVRRYDDYIPPVQFIQEGLCALNTHEVAIPRYDVRKKKIVNDPLPCGNSAEWWANLPVYETISLEEACKRCQGLDGLKPGMILHGTTETATVELSGNHGYVEFLFPGGDGTYKVYSFGKTVKKAPHGTIENIKFFTDTVAARICCIPDQNEEFSNRENWGIGFSLPKEEIDRIQEVVYKYVERTKKEKVPYSLVGKNCHAFVASMARKVLLPTLPLKERATMKKKIEELTLMDFYDSKRMPAFKNFGSNLLLQFLRLGKKERLPKRLKAITGLLGGWRSFSYQKDGKLKKKSVTSTKPTINGKFFCPAKFSLLVKERAKMPTQTPMAIYKRRNRLYVANGMDFLKEMTLPN